MSKKTKASVKDGRLTVFAADARTLAVTAWGLDQVSSGAFELSPAENEGTALVFKPSGKKAAETVAVYNTSKQAEAALTAVYGALNNRHKQGSGFFGSTLKSILKITAIIVGVLLLLGFISTLFMPSDIDDPNYGETSLNVGELPVGEPFPVDDYVRQTAQ